MPNILELTVYIVSSHLSNVQMTSDEMFQELQNVHAALNALEAGIPIASEPDSTPEPPKLTVKQAFKKNEVICMICGKSFTTLKKHLTVAHDLKPGQYRKQFGIPSTQSLAAKSYIESRRKTAIDRGFGEGLAKYRDDRAAKKASVPMVKIKAPVPTVKVIAPVPVVKDKAGLPAVRVKAPVPAKSAVSKKSTK